MGSHGLALSLEKTVGDSQKMQQSKNFDINYIYAKDMFRFGTVGIKASIVDVRADNGE